MLNVQKLQLFVSQSGRACSSRSCHFFCSQSFNALLPLLHERAEGAQQRPQHVAAAGASDVLLVSDVAAHLDLQVDVEDRHEV